MASSDDIVEGSISSRLIVSFKSNQNGDMLSPEELAWVDSCFIKVPQVSDGDWGSMKNALMEILGLQPQSNGSSVHETEGFPGGTDIETLHSSEQEIVKPFVRTDEHSMSINKEMETSNDDFPFNEETSISSSQLFQEGLSETSLKNVFLPNYREDYQRAIESDDSGLIGSSTNETEPSTQDIFKVWDLGIPLEEDELLNQLNKALSESDQKLMPSTDNSGAWKDLKLESIDDLIAGITDLSLNQHSE